MEKRYVEGVDGEESGRHSFTRKQLSFLLGMPKGMTREQVCAAISESVRAFRSSPQALIFRLRYDIFGDMNAGKDDGISVIGWVLDNSYNGNGEIDSKRVVDLIFQLRDEAGNGRKA